VTRNELIDYFETMAADEETDFAMAFDELLTAQEGKINSDDLRAVIAEFRKRDDALGRTLREVGSPGVFKILWATMSPEERDEFMEWAKKHP
jgi:hypothetical protein